MFDDVGKTIKAILYDRIVSPLFGTFVLSWCAWNWRLILLFISDSSTTVAKKFQYVDSELYPSNGVTYIYGLLLPATTTAFFIYVYPPIARKVYGYWREQQNKLKKVQIEKDGETPLKEEEAQEIKNQALLSELRYQEEREKREARIKDLENLVMSLQAKNEAALTGTTMATESQPSESQESEKKPKFKLYSEQVENGMFAVLKLIDNLAPGGFVDKDTFMMSAKQDGDLSKLENTLLLHCLDNLIEGQYVTRGSMGRLSAQPKGRAALVNGRFDE